MNRKDLKNSSSIFGVMSGTKRPWTTEEDEKLRDFISKHGAGNWSQIAETLTNRTGKQCRERWHNHLNPGIVKGEWTEREDRIIITMQRAIGNQWAKITKLLPGRTDNAVKNRFHATTRNRRIELEESGLDDLLPDQTAVMYAQKMMENIQSHQQSYMGHQTIPGTDLPVTTNLVLPQQTQGLPLNSLPLDKTGDFMPDKRTAPFSANVPNNYPYVDVTAMPYSPTGTSVPGFSGFPSPQTSVGTNQLLGRAVAAIPISPTNQHGIQQQIPQQYQPAVARQLSSAIPITVPASPDLPSDPVFLDPDSPSQSIMSFSPLTATSVNLDEYIDQWMEDEMVRETEEEDEAGCRLEIQPRCSMPSFLWGGHQQQAGPRGYGNAHETEERSPRMCGLSAWNSSKPSFGGSNTNKNNYYEGAGVPVQPAMVCPTPVYYAPNVAYPYPASQEVYTSQDMEECFDEHFVDRLDEYFTHNQNMNY